MDGTRKLSGWRKRAVWVLLYCLAYIAAQAVACVGFVKLLPAMGGLFVSDEGVLRFLRSLSRAAVSPALWGSFIVCALLSSLFLIRELRIKKYGLAPKRTVPLYFSIPLWLSFLPVFAATLYFSRINLVPVRVIINFVWKISG